MNICMVGLGVGKTHGAWVGGHVNNMINLSKSLSQNKMDVHIVTTPPIYFNKEKLDESFQLVKGVTIHTQMISKGLNSDKISKKGRLSLKYGLESCFKIISAIKNLHEKENFDVIHSHSCFPLVGLIPAYLKSFEHLSAVHTLYCPIEGPFNKTLAISCLRGLNSTIAISDNVKKSLKWMVPDSKLRVIPPLIDIHRFSQNLNKDECSTQYLIYIGNLSKSKGLFTLLESLKNIKTTFPDIKLLLGLDIPLEQLKKGRFLEFEHKIRSLDLKDNVVPLGIIKDLPRIMAMGDVFVAPFNDTQGPADYPLSVLEAMATGLPIVATNVGGLPEIVKNGETGLLVNPNDPLELSRAIIILLEDKNLSKKMGENGKKFVEKLSKDILNDHISIYKGIAGV